MQRYCIAKRWTFTFTGRAVIVEGEANKVVGWLDRFKVVGDIVANVDPTHVWAGIRLLLEVNARASKWITQRSYASIYRLPYLRRIR